MIRVLLVDDEELARDRLRRLLGSFADVSVVGEACDGEEALQKTVELRPDAVFLDVEMPGASGLEVVRSLGEPRPKVIFCTGYDQYAVDAFELHAADYLLKPVTRPRLQRSIERLRSTPATAWDAAVERVAHAQAHAVTRFLARSGTKYRVVAQKDVLYFASEDGLTVVHTADGRFLMDPTLNMLERHLDPAQFFRISRSAVVKIDVVFEVAPLVGGHGELLLRNGARLEVSRRRFRELLQRVGGAIGGSPS
jgi:two-component system, LytTR family, response regulator